MAHARARRRNLKEQSVAVAVGPNALHPQAVPRLLSLEPEPPARAAVEDGPADLERLAQRLFVHVAHHQDTPARFVLDDGRNQAAELAEIEIHPRRQNKKGPPNRGGRIVPIFFENP